jgi:hypothetical protein
LDVATYIVRQMEGVRFLLGAVLADVSLTEWTAAPAAGQNPIGFTAWHVPSIQDWAIRTWMQNIEPLRGRPEWREKGMMTSFLPFGMDIEVARKVAAATAPGDVLNYADAILDEPRAFLGALPETHPNYRVSGCAA